MIDPEEFNKILEWFSDEKNVKKLSPLEFGQYMGAAMEFAEKLKPIYLAHNKDSFEWIVRDLFKDGNGRN
jgi:hypothetical protein